MENQYDYSALKAYQAIDDWSYNYIDQVNLKRFLKGMGHVPTQTELISIIRRFDLDSDGKISLKEFEIGMKTRLTVFKPNKSV